MPARLLSEKYFLRVAYSDEKHFFFAMTALCFVQPVLSASAHQDMTSPNAELQADNAINPGKHPVPADAPVKEPSVILAPRPREITSVSQLFGWPGGYVHAALALNSEYSDNIFNTGADQQNNILTQLIPTLWLTVPGSRWKPIHIASHNTSPGGLQFPLKETEQVINYQVYLLGGLNFKKYSTDSTLDTTDGNLEAMAQYKMTEKTSFQLVDKFTRTQDQFNFKEATIENRRSYHSNLLQGSGTWNLREKISTTFNYTYFRLSYEEAINNILNRTDNGISCKLNYIYSPKTTIFLQYSYLYSDYNSAEEKNNSNKYMYLGVNWRMSDKTSFNAKAGYQLNNYTNDLTRTKQSTFSYEMQAVWQVTVKTSISLAGTYGIDQSDSQTALYKQVLSGRIGYEQKISDHLFGLIQFQYENSKYDQFSNANMHNKRYYVKPILQYNFKQWLAAELYYTHDIMNSNETNVPYTTNCVGLTVKFSL